MEHYKVGITLHILHIRKVIGIALMMLKSEE